MKPEPKPLNIVCSNCGMKWDAHGEKPTVDKCVELLKAELARRPMWQANMSSTPYYGSAMIYQQKEH